MANLFLKSIFASSCARHQCSFEVVYTSRFKFIELRTRSALFTVLTY